MCSGGSVAVDVFDFYSGLHTYSLSDISTCIFTDSSHHECTYVQSVAWKTT